MYGSHELIVWTTPMRVERDPASTELVAAVVVVAAVTTGKNSMATRKH